MSIIRFENVHYTYPDANKESLCGVDLAIEEGSFVAVLGHNDQRYRGKPASVLSIEGLEIDLASHSVKANGKPVTLTDTEYAILEYLVKNRGKVVTAAELYEAVWEEKFLSGSGNTVMVHVLNVRRKIEENPSKPKILRTVWGRGYQID